MVFETAETRNLGGKQQALLRTFEGPKNKKRYLIFKNEPGMLLKINKKLPG